MRQVRWRVSPSSPRPSACIALLFRRLARQEAAGLAMPEIGIEATLAQKRIMRTFFHDAAVVHDDQPVHGGNGRQAVGDGNNRLALHETVETLLDCRLDLGIERAR